MEALKKQNIVLVHDWLTGLRGGEKCLEYFCERWPDAPLYTLLHSPGSTNETIENRLIHTSFLQKFPRVHRYYRYLLPLMPRAIQFKIPQCDLVISCSHCVAKSVNPPPGVPHICYCFTPMRYAWHMKQSYFGAESRGIKNRMRDGLLWAIREWDRKTANRVSHFVAISKTVAQRIHECYGRDSAVIYPPVDTQYYFPTPVPRENYYLVVSAFAPYKRIDLAIEACNRLNKQLVLIGQGQHEKKLRALAGPTIHFLGWQSNEAIRNHLRQCRALLFPGEEDFGIVPVEAQACGSPVIAYGRGGATETVLPVGRHAEPTGLWFGEQTVESLCAAMEEFETIRNQFSRPALRRHAEQFRGERFEKEIFQYIENVLRTPSLDRRVAA